MAILRPWHATEHISDEPKLIRDQRLCKKIHHSMHIHSHPQSFFGRAFNKSQVIPECRKRSKCVINKITRTACKACRLTKCLQVGMSKDGSRFGRRSNWFKMKFRLADQPTDDQYARTPSELVDASAPGLHYSQPFPSGGTSADQLATEPHRIGLPYAFDQPQALAGPFYPAPVQYPFHPTLLHRAFEGERSHLLMLLAQFLFVFSLNSASIY